MAEAGDQPKKKEEEKKEKEKIGERKKKFLKSVPVLVSCFCSQEQKYK